MPHGTGRFGNGMMLVWLIFDNRICKVCNDRIGPFGWCFALPDWYRRAMHYGPCDNETHCGLCHLESENHHEGQCQHCKHQSAHAPNVLHYLRDIEDAFQEWSQAGCPNTEVRGPEWLKVGLAQRKLGILPTEAWAFAQPEIRHELLDPIR